ncbi:Bifunctional sulfatase/alpha-L-rhamnosidase [Arenibacter antarcticus]|uniref:Sulfatase-like hydrolase/transferase n=1 Tax=Arenibacter antarcticus TaxID=2040469 RepID=A0ABW5VHI1_9FLAO|nr:sulfatase-like hydrolase/transferase [Arenibacter sp. H213]MCM4167127.1 hypothetical protein [Arenibacter sp. H213]
MEMFKKRYLLVLAIIFLFGSCNGINRSKKVKQKSPNIIFILTDDQGWTHRSHRADPNIPESESDYYETPNMDKLAKSGILFTEGYAPNPICSPSRHSIMLGQNAARHIYNKDLDWYKKTSDWLTIPRAIKKANPKYKTAHFGKWHIAMEPKVAGFDYDDGMTSNNGGEIFEDGFINIKEFTKVSDEYLEANNIQNPTNMRRAGKPSGHWNDENAKDIFGITDRAEAFMKGSIAEGKPFYVQLSHYAVHLSLVSRKETYEYFKNKKRGERHTNPEFAAMLKDLDTGVGRIMDFVKSMGIEDNTYIFLMGDNGGRLSLNQIAKIDHNKELVEAYYSTQNERNIPLRNGKHSFYEGGLRVPFIASGPGINANRVSRTPVTGLDLLPTFTDLAGGDVEMPKEIDGGTMAPLLLNESEEKVVRNSKYLIFHQGSHRPPRSAIQNDKYKLVKYWPSKTDQENRPTIELFHIAEDLGETMNIIEMHSEIAKELELELNKFLDTTNAETGNQKVKGPYYRLMDDLGKTPEEERWDSE